ncbi:MAG: hypothetical protein A3C58_00920 [Candidatus Staskawiczbacteria bacterium RIFCSPHIGHO2_02_FULL_34_10]|uniref:HD/PDEase domain-containing protein n=1 Tax=Candidatus Staskawiczbacteria bacterium RIFCSPHIGHO2_02_FULL_34_10 TaxID=1802205 RepID=A0A1G2HWF9_9BACT|nr:MAG: hypothetical protein A3C58_00920 [Candidatus Staskawiczbacteria bacterium RIFCSPHIGHO2_02_FULL_34_10]
MFLNYLEADPSLRFRAEMAFAHSGCTIDNVWQVFGFLQPLKAKDLPTYEHSLRVDLLASQIAKFVHLDPKALLYAGLLHDVGKAQTRLATLQKTDGWTEADTEEIMNHVMDGYRLIRDKFDFSTEIILWHHRFQPRGYPKEMSTLLHKYCEGTKVMIPWYGRMLCLADTFDAFHRVNDKHGDMPITGE